MLDFIVNPTAGGKNGKKIKKSIAKIEEYLTSLGVLYTIHYTLKKHDATTLTSSLIDNGATDIIVVGGDGSLHEVINGFHSFEKVNLGLIPCGTGNDFASALKLPLDPIKAVDVILNNKAQYTDFMQMPTVRGINIIGMGIDVDVLKRYASLKKKTKFSYTSCLIKTLLDFEYSDFTVDMNDKEENHRSFVAVVANGHAYGGGLSVCPIANPTDKKLDFVAVSELSKIKIIGAFLKLKQGKILSLKQAHHENMTEIKIHTQKPVTVNVDGELYENIPFEVKIVSDTLKMYRP